MNVFGFRLCIALSGSMEPTIQTDALCLTDMRPQEYKTGDIITKGDNNERADPWRTDSKDVIGKVVWIGNFFASI